MRIPYIKLNIEISFKNQVRHYFIEALIRGALGHFSKKLVCINKDQPCENCILRDNCSFYTAFISDFRGELQFNDITTVPHPYLLYYQKTTDNTGVIEIIFFNKLFHHIHCFIYTFIKMGEAGIGKDRNHFSIQKVIEAQTGENLFDAENLQFTTPAPQQFCLNGHVREAADNIKIEFFSPLRLKSNKKFVNEIEFARLIKSALIRLSLLSQIYGQYDLRREQIRDLLDQAEGVVKESEDLKLIKRLRYSQTQEKKMNMGGLVGSVVYQGNITPFLDILLAAGEFGIGKNTTFGCGKFRYEVLS